MTISSSVVKSGPYDGNDLTVSFAYGFKIFSGSDLRVTKIDANGTPTILAIGIDYTVTGAGDELGGSVLYPVSGSQLSIGETLTIESNIPIEQQTDLSNQDGFFSEVHETVFDKLCRMVQQVVASASLKFAAGSGYYGLTLPDPEAGKILQWKDDLSGMKNVSNVPTGAVTISSYIENLLDDSDAAEATSTLSTTYVVANKATAILLSSSAGKTLYILSEDGRGDIWRFVTGASPGTYSDNAGSFCGTVFIPSGGDGSSAWLRDNTGPLNVKWFGAKGDDSTDDTASIQAAIDYASVTSQGVVLFPVGTYIVTSSLVIESDGISLIGGGDLNYALSVIKRTNSGSYGNTLAIRKNPTTTVIYDATISGITFASSVAMTSNAHVKVQGGKNFHLSYCKFTNCFTAIELARTEFEINTLEIDYSSSLYGATPAVGSSGILFTDNSTISASTTGRLYGCEIKVRGSAGVAYPVEYCYKMLHADGVWLDSCYSRGASIAGFGVVPTVAGVLCSGVQFNNCWSDWCAIGYLVRNQVAASVHDIRFIASYANGRALAASTNGIVVHGPDPIRNVTISGGNYASFQDEGIIVRDGVKEIHIGDGLHVADCDLALTGGIGCIHILNSVSEFQISNVKAGGDGLGGAGNQDYGIVVSATAHNRYMITNNMLFDNATSGLLDNGTGLTKLVTDNLP